MSYLKVRKSPSAIFLSILRIILPERVLGKPKQTVFYLI
jgi:hypothetical protein